MKRLFSLVLMLALLGSVLGTSMAQDDMAPEGTWLGTWPYTLPPEHHLNGFASGGPNSNLGNIYRSFVEMPPAFYHWATDEYEGLLAESWGFTEDNSAYEITLKADMTWSNGDPISSQDILTTYSLGRLIGWSQFGSIDVVEAVDDLTVRFNFIDEASLRAERLLLKDYIVASATYGDFAARAEELFATGADSESEEWQALLAELQEFRPEELVASGPYTYSLDDVGDASMLLQWQPNSIYSGSVQFGEIKLWAGETESTTPLVLSGELAHSTNVYPPATVETFQDAGINIVTIPRGYGPALLFNLARSPWDNATVRQAAALVIDRAQNAFLTNGFGGMATETMSGVLDSSASAMIPGDVLAGLDAYAFDTDRAATLLEGAGFSLNDDGVWADADGNTLSGEWVFPQEFADFAGATQDAAAQMNAFGFDITLRALPWQEVPDLIRNGDFDLTVWSWGSGSPLAALHFRNPIQRWASELSEEQPGLGIDYNVEHDGESYNLDELISGVNAGLDGEAHRERAGLVAQILNENMFYVPLNIILSAEPFNTEFISGLPEAGDPILLNPTGSDHFMILYLLEGRLSPTE